MQRMHLGLILRICVSTESDPYWSLPFTPSLSQNVPLPNFLLLCTQLSPPYSIQLEHNVLLDRMAEHDQIMQKPDCRRLHALDWLYIFRLTIHLLSLSTHKLSLSIMHLQYFSSLWMPCRGSVHPHIHKYDQPVSSLLDYCYAFVLIAISIRVRIHFNALQQLVELFPQLIASLRWLCGNDLVLESLKELHSNVMRTHLYP